MNKLTLKIKEIKNVKDLEIELPVEKGIYVITGSNGSGKSTVMVALSKLFREKAYKK
jgi:chromosome segregation ATPase